jgi:hypothetical protein
MPEGMILTFASDIQRSGYHGASRIVDAVRRGRAKALPPQDIIAHIKSVITPSGDIEWTGRSTYLRDRDDGWCPNQDPTVACKAYCS